MEAKRTVYELAEMFPHVSVEEIISMVSIIFPKFLHSWNCSKSKVLSHQGDIEKVADALSCMSLQPNTANSSSNSNPSKKFVKFEKQTIITHSNHLKQKANQCTEEVHNRLFFLSNWGLFSWAQCFVTAFHWIGFKICWA